MATNPVYSYHEKRVYIYPIGAIFNDKQNILISVQALARGRLV